MALLKILLARYQLRTPQALMKTLHEGLSVEQIWARQKFSSMRFFVDAADRRLWQAYTERFPQTWRAVVEEADTICRHEFNLLGSGYRSWGTPIDWHLDPKSGYRWPKKFYAELARVPATANGADVKVPYELSRLQHLPTLGKAYCLTKNERYAQELVAQMTHWLDENPCLQGVNWTCAMDVAIRLVNIIWGLAFVEGSPALTMDYKQRIWASLWEHGQYVMRHLEYSIRPDGTLGNHNHYLANIVGLVYVGILFPEFKAATRWRHIGVTALAEEMERQVLPDGMDYESSTSYHRLVLEIFTSAALLCRLNGLELPEGFWTKLEKMYTFTLCITRPDGKVPQIGDADDGRLHILSDYGAWDRTDHRYLLSLGAVLFQRPDMKAAAGAFAEEAFWLLGREKATLFDALESFSASLDSKAFPESGFYVMRSSRTYLLACCNPVGTAGAGNHKHNDLLSFELYLGDRALIVDPGAYIYTAAPEWRNRFRSTRYHNTVVVDEQEQNRLPQHKLFRLTPDAEPIVQQWCSTADYDWLDAEHTGYRRLPRPVSHRRTFRLDKRKERVQIIDTLRGVGEHTVAWYFHFDYGIDVEIVSDHIFVANAGTITLLMQVAPECPIRAEMQDGWISRGYGTKLPAKILKLSGIFSEHCQIAFEAHCQ
jgi:hypothetical protein